MTKIQATSHIWHNGERFSPGEVIVKIEEHDAKQLVKNGAAFFVGEYTPPIEPPHLENQSGGFKQAADDQEDDRLALDENFTLEELKEDAQRFGITFVASIKKAALISQILSEGKAQHFLDLLED